MNPALETILFTSNWTFARQFGLNVWIDLADPSTLFQDSALTTPATADTNPLGGIKDKSGFDRNVLQATAANRPLLRTGIQNGYPIARFDGVNDSLVASTWSLVQPYTVYLVAKWATPNNNILDGTSAINTGLIYTPANSEVNIFAGTNVTDGLVPSGKFFLTTAVFDGSNSGVRVNDAPFSFGNAGTASPGGMTLGVRGDLTSFGTPDIAEVAIVTGRLPATDSKAMKYLKRKWALEF